MPFLFNEFWSRSLFDEFRLYNIRTRLCHCFILAVLISILTLFWSKSITRTIFPYIKARVSICLRELQQDVYLILQVFIPHSPIIFVSTLNYRAFTTYGLSTS